MPKCFFKLNNVDLSIFYTRGINALRKDTQFVFVDVTSFKNYRESRGLKSDKRISRVE